MSRKKNPDAEPDASEPSFEQALERLESIVDDLESGNLVLEASIARYEEGMKLSRLLTRKLDEAEKKIERLMEAGENESPETEPMELELKPQDRSGSRSHPSESEELPF